MGIFSFLKRKEVLKEISEEEKLVLDLSQAIKNLEDFDKFIKRDQILSHTSISLVYGGPAFVEEYEDKFRNAINWLKEAKKRIYLIEDIAKRRIKEKPESYRRSPSPEEKAKREMKEAEPLLEEVIEFIIPKIKDVGDWFNDVNEFKKRFDGLEDKISYLKKLKENIIILIDLEKKAQEEIKVK